MRIAAKAMKEKLAAKRAYRPKISYASGLVSCGIEVGSCGFKSIGYEGFPVELPHTKMAYISHSLSTSVSVNTASIAKQERESTTPEWGCGNRFVRYSR
jgi:hypothetical protein